MNDENTPAEDSDLDTTDGTRDPLSTDDGLIAASAEMPEVPEDRQIDDADDPADQAGQPNTADPTLEVDEDGADPLAEFAREED